MNEKERKLIATIAKAAQELLKRSESDGTQDDSNSLDPLNTFIAERLDRAADGVITIGVFHSTFKASLSEYERASWPKKRIIEHLLNQGFEVNDAGGHTSNTKTRLIKGLRWKRAA